MSAFKDLAAQRFGSLKVLGQLRRVAGQPIKWVCLCDCGTFKIARTHELTSGKVSSCGCVSSAYTSWKKMRERCYNANAGQYKYYGAKGVRVCERWATYANFYADMGPRPAGMTLDRTDPTKDYGPDNCRWATREEQDANKRVHHATA